MKKMKDEKRESQFNNRRIVDYESIPETLWITKINVAKEMVDEFLPCHTHCPESSKCRKLSGYEEKLEALREVMKPRLDRNIKDARMRLSELVREAISLRLRINRCVFVRKRLTYKEGYRMWYPSPD